MRKLTLFAFLLLSAEIFSQTPIKGFVQNGDTVAIGLENAYALYPKSSGSVIRIRGAKEEVVSDSFTTIIADNCGTFIEIHATNVAYPPGYSTIGVNPSWIERVLPNGTGSFVKMNVPQTSYYATEPPSYFEPEFLAELCGGAIDSIAASLPGRIYRSADNFATFSPSSPAPVNGDFCIDTRRGNIWQKTGGSFTTRVTYENGSLASTTALVSNDTLLFDAALYNRAQLSTPSSGTTVVVSAPTNIGTQAIGEIYQIIIQNNNDSSVTVNWNSVFGKWDMTSVTSTVTAGTTIGFLWQTVSDGAEGVVLASLNDLGGGGSTITTGDKVDIDVVTLNSDWQIDTATVGYTELQSPITLPSSGTFTWDFNGGADATKITDATGEVKITSKNTNNSVTVNNSGATITTPAGTLDNTSTATTYTALASDGIKYAANYAGRWGVNDSLVLIDKNYADSLHAISQVGGSSTQIQYNNNGVFGGVTGFTWNGSALTLPATVNTSLTQGSVVFAGASGALSQDNSNFFWDDTNNRLGIGTASPSKALSVEVGSTTDNGLFITKSGTIAASLFANSSTNEGALGLRNGGTLTTFLTSSTGTTSYINNAGSLAIGTNTASARLHVRGDGTNSVARFENSAGTQAITILNTALGIRGTSSFEVVPFVNGGEPLYLGCSNGNSINRSGYSVIFGNQVSFNETSGTNGAINILGSAAPTSGTQVTNFVNIAPTVNQTGGANGITRGLYVNPTLTAAADFRYIECAGNIFQIGSNGYTKMAGVDSYADLPIRSNGTGIARLSTNGLTIGSSATAPTYTLDIQSTNAIRTAVGTTAQEPTGAVGTFRYNSTTGTYRGVVTGTTWVDFLTTANATAFGGSLATNQVAFGSATNTISGNANFTYSSPTLTLQSAGAAPLNLQYTGGTNTTLGTNSNGRLTIIPSGGKVGINVVGATGTFQVSEAGTGNQTVFLADHAGSMSNGEMSKWQHYYQGAAFGHLGWTKTATGFDLDVFTSTGGAENGTAAVKFGASNTATFAGTIASVGNMTITTAAASDLTVLALDDATISSSDVTLISSADTSTYTGTNHVKVGTANESFRFNKADTTARLYLNGSEKLKFNQFGTGQIIAGSSTWFAGIGGVIKDFYTNVGNVGAGADDLYSATLPANILNANGQKIEATYAGTTVATVSPALLEVYFAGTKISGDVNGTGAGSWRIEVTIIRTGTSTARSIVNIQLDEDTQNHSQLQTDLTSLDFTGTNILKIVGTSDGTPSDNDIVAKMGTIKWFPAAGQ